MLFWLARRAIPRPRPRRSCDRGPQPSTYQSAWVLCLLMILFGLIMATGSRPVTPLGQYPAGVNAPYGWTSDGAGHYMPVGPGGTVSAYDAGQARLAYQPTPRSQIGIWLLAIGALGVVLLVVHAVTRRPAAPRPPPPTPAPGPSPGNPTPPSGGPHPWRPYAGRLWED